MVKTGSIYLAEDRNHTGEPPLVTSLQLLVKHFHNIPIKTMKNLSFNVWGATDYVK